MIFALAVPFAWNVLQPAGLAPASHHSGVSTAVPSTESSFLTTSLPYLIFSSNLQKFYLRSAYHLFLLDVTAGGEFVFFIAGFLPLNQHLAHSTP